MDSSIPLTCRADGFVRAATVVGGGFALRLVVALTSTPESALVWYVPFVEHFYRAPSLDPWGAWLADGGDPAAFPYGYSMLAVLNAASALSSAAPIGAKFSYLLVLLVVEVALLMTLLRLVDRSVRPVALALYWFAPLVIFSTYGMGHNDLVPALFVVAALVALRASRVRMSALLLALAVSAKMSAAFVVSVLLVYVINQPEFRARWMQFLSVFGVATALLVGPQFWFPGARFMLVENPEFAKVASWFVEVGPGSGFFVLPTGYAVLLYATWRLRRIGFSEAIVLVGVAQVLVVLATPAAGGWFVWAVPYLVVYGAVGDRAARWLVFALMSIALLPLLDAVFLIDKNIQFAGIDAGLAIASVVFAAGAVVGIRMWRDVSSAQPWRNLRDRPFVVGIAGDSGVGKDTAATGLARAFGDGTCALLSGDDYHRRARLSSIWSQVTHLNPVANDLARMRSDIRRLAARQSVIVSHYSHKTGRFEGPHSIHPKDVVIVSGLHVLLENRDASLYDLSIYLDMSEDLRIFLKKQRDEAHRSAEPRHVEKTVMRRQPDRAEFINPQRASADVVIRVDTESPLGLQDGASALGGLRVSAWSAFDVGFEALARDIVTFTSAAAWVESGETNGSMTLRVSGDVAMEELDLIGSRSLARQPDHPLASKIPWNPGAAGVVQLVLAVAAASTLSRRTVR